MSTASNHRPSSPVTAELGSPVADATLTNNLSFHALWSIDISRQRLSQLTSTLPDGSPAPSPFPPVMGYLNMSNNHLGITAIVTGLEGVKAILHLNIIGNPAMRGFGIQQNIALLPQHRDHSLSNPVATFSGGSPLSLSEARDVLVASLPSVWCLNFAFIDPETDKRASSTIGKCHLGHLLPRFSRFTGHILGGSQGRASPQVVNPWGKKLVDSIPKALDYDWRSCFWQLRALAKDVDGEVLEDGMDRSDVGALGSWADFPIDNSAAGLMLSTSLMFILDPWVSKELARACLPNVWEVLAKSSPGRKLPPWSTLLATASVQVFKVVAILLGVLANDACTCKCQSKFG
ncbi:hypothetical protein BCR44DRAFT_1267252 [Catenaria anguillulae PL171]|uniref:Uncharacterized protein n=1 Tax=Catenaria anguillulae PL171 TaxID=765915 RepID=A0A1Y2HX39_9FUNG|nr:hypothetical protein BCR44DRAFT_1267252 [Catenaria anguillulae PL171]